MNKTLKKWLLSVLFGFLALSVILAVLWFSYSTFVPTYNPDFNYLAVLKASPAYDYAEKENVVFSYESENSPNLTRLREMYALDKIAGANTDFEKAKNLLKWVHDLIPYDGRYPLPAQRDAISLISTAKNPGQGLNCRGLAIILSEALLSVGVKAKFVELIPKDISSDSHVVTLAYVSELDQWVFLDPSYEAYFVNESNHYLGISEIRASLINDSVLKVNDEINYNGGPVDVDYLHYLSKNLYRFASPEYSAFGIDSSPERKMVVLNPAGNNDGRGLNIFSRNEIIHNPDTFWAKP
jgi:transglutaminase-like putative cysteine protease